MKKNSVLLLAFITIFNSCIIGDPHSEPKNPPMVLGLSYTQSENDFSATYATLIGALEANPNIGIVAQVNHTANANSVDLTLNPTAVVLFGNPNLGTPLMQKNQLAGLDLPQKMLVYKNDKKEVYLGFNNTDYLTGRHQLEGVATLPTIENALTNLSTNASGGELNSAENNDITSEEGIITKTSTLTFDEAYGNLRTAIDNNPNLRIIAEVDHQANATSVNMELNPTRVIIFGNPNLGTPLMQSMQTTGIDLPQKILVWEDNDGAVHVSYNSPDFLRQRHGIEGNAEILETITMALNNLSNVAAGQ